MYSFLWFCSPFCLGLRILGIINFFVSPVRIVLACDSCNQANYRLSSKCLDLMQSSGTLQIKEHSSYFWFMERQLCAIHCYSYNFSALSWYPRKKVHKGLDRALLRCRHVRQWIADALHYKALIFSPRYRFCFCWCWWSWIIQVNVICVVGVSLMNQSGHRVN